MIAIASIRSDFFMRAIMSTNKGDIHLTLFDDAPMTVASFVFLAKKGFYNGVVFHRVIDNFMIQGGDPTGTGRGGPKDKKVTAFTFGGKQVPYPFKDEFQNRRVFDHSGIFAMANAGPNTNGSQFFITHVPTTHLNGKHTIFGEVEGPEDQDIVNSIEQGDQIVSVEIEE
jgi:peptidyl-prolyl cis-trans isomerase B (cyclophilin B)